MQHSHLSSCLVTHFGPSTSNLILCETRPPYGKLALYSSSSSWRVRKLSSESIGNEMGRGSVFVDGTGIVVLSDDDWELGLEMVPVGEERMRYGARRREMM